MLISCLHTFWIQIMLWIFIFSVCSVYNPHPSKSIGQPAIVVLCRVCQDLIHNKETISEMICGLCITNIFSLKDNIFLYGQTHFGQHIGEKLERCLVAQHNGALVRNIDRYCLLCFFMTIFCAIILDNSYFLQYTVQYLYLKIYFVDLLKF